MTLLPPLTAIFSLCISPPLSASASLWRAPPPFQPFRSREKPERPLQSRISAASPLFGCSGAVHVQNRNAREFWNGGGRSRSGRESGVPANHALDPGVPVEVLADFFQNLGFTAQIAQAPRIGYKGLYVLMKNHELSVVVRENSVAMENQIMVESTNPEVLIALDLGVPGEVFADFFQNLGSTAQIEQAPHIGHKGLYVLMKNHELSVVVQENSVAMVELSFLKLT